MSRQGNSAKDRQAEIAWRATATPTLRANLCPPKGWFAFAKIPGILAHSIIFPDGAGYFAERHQAIAFGLYHYPNAEVQR